MFGRFKKKTKKKDSCSPKVELKGIIAEPDGKIRVELDWDDEFIEHLRSNGYTGPDDNAIIQKYLLELTRTISDDLGGLNDYE